MLDAPQGVTHLNRIAHAVLILENDVKTGDDIAYQILSAESDGETGESSDRGNRCDIDAEFLDGRDQGYGPHHFVSGAVNHPSKDAGLLLAGLRGARLRGGGLDDQVGNETEQVVQDERDEKDADEADEIGYREIGHVGWETRHKLVGG